MPELLLVRPDDHVIAGVSLPGFGVGAGPDGSPRLVAGENARLIVTFPPQHVAEEASFPDTPAPFVPFDPPVPVWRSVLAGRSRVAFSVEPGTTIVPTVAGVLDAIGAAAVRPPSVPPGDEDTAIELPWRLVLAPLDSAGATVHCVQATAPVTASGVTGLWCAKFTGSAATPLDAGLSLRPVDGDLAGRDDDLGFEVALAAPERSLIVLNSATHPATASRLELGALGGTLSADGVWENFRWRQRTVLGRDLSVETAVTGRLYPLGHRAVLEVFSERQFDPNAGNAAVLRRWSVLTVTEPVRRPPADLALRRGFPFDDVEILTRVYAGLGEPDWQEHAPPDGRPPLRTHFFPTNLAGEFIRFPLRVGSPAGDLRCDLPLIFVADLSPEYDSLTDPTLADALAGAYGAEEVRLPGANLDLVRSPNPRDGDVHEVHALDIAGRLTGDGYRPALAGLEVRVPALRSLTGFDAPTPVRFAANYLARGDTEDVLLELTGAAIGVDFTRCAQRSGGLVSPAFAANGLSRSFGPVNLAGLPNPVTGLLDPKRVFPPEATILGFPIRDLVSQVRVPPQITSVVRTGRPPAVTMRWEDVKLSALGPFTPTAATRMNLTVTTGLGPAGAPQAHTTCTVNDFALVLPPGPRALLELSFARIEFTQVTGRQPDLRIDGLRAEFLGLLQLLEELQNAVDLAGAARFLDVTPSGITARYSLPVPSVSAGAFSLRNIAVHTAVEVPFDARPVQVTLGFSSRANPFNLSVLMLGGGGYIEVVLDRNGLRRLEAALEFGALVAIDFLVASGEVHALGGVRFTLEQDGSVSLEGYLRIGGCVEVLGLVSVSVEMRIGLTYHSDRKALVGRATLVVEVDLTLWSESVELDSGEWVLAGGTAAVPGPRGLRQLDGPALDLQRWRDYRAVFAH
ncbi:hypothetical protein [Amycolatopsis sp. NPDC021455]|uniref:hypothetical protein n=1 Tax=Amycolatopsis sp. NPDC021455 TaxID=3154901 RepID=UPI0033F1700F